MSSKSHSFSALILTGLIIILVSVQIGKTIGSNRENLRLTLSQPDSKPDKAKTTNISEKDLLVTKILDGDTFIVGTGEIVRLIGIDTPEKGECFSEEAKARATELLLNNRIQYEKDISYKDRYDRTLLYVWLDGEFINEKMVKDGFAISRQYPPDTKYAQILAEAEKTAKLNKVGIWGVLCRKQ